MRYIPALDGIRALAVAAVVLYHLHLPWAQGGLLGVTVFFVISGFIITRLLLSELAQLHRIDFKRFYLRRVRRLVPAVVTVVLATAVLTALFNHVMLTKMRPDILPSLLFFNNWWQIARHVSYFSNLGDPSPLTHFWSLAIEEQFYLVWPPLLFALYRAGASRPLVRRVVLGLAAASAIAMTVLYTPDADPSRVYYGTDTRAFSLLAGVWLALLPKAAIDKSTGRHGLAIEVGGVIGLVGLVAMLMFSNGYTAFQYRGGMVLCTVLTVMLIAASARRGGVLARVLAAPPLVWMGTRSYGIYLWHYPLLLLMNPVARVSAIPWWQTVLQLAIVLAVAEASYRFIETPFRHGAAGAFIAAAREAAAHGAEGWRALTRRYAVPLGCGAALVLASVVGLAVVPDTSALSAEGAAALQKSEGADSGSSTEVAASSASYDKGAYDILLIGDSVSVRTIPYFQQVFPYGFIDAKESRQFEVGIELFQSYLDQGKVGGIVVFCLGTNGLVTDDQVNELMQKAGNDRRVVFVTTRSPQPWVGATNQALEGAAQRYKNVRVVDWYSFSNGRDDLFDGDGTHLNETGAQTYVGLIRDAVRDVLPVHVGDGKSDRTPGAVQTAATGFGNTLAAAMANALANPKASEEG